MPIDLSREPVTRLLTLAAKGDITAARELQRREICTPYAGSLDDVVMAAGELPKPVKLVTGRAPRGDSMSRTTLPDELTAALETRRMLALDELRAKTAGASLPGDERSATDQWLDWIGNLRLGKLKTLVAADIVTVDEVRAAVLVNSSLWNELEFLEMLRLGWLQADEVREALRATVVSGERRR